MLFFRCQQLGEARGFIDRRRGVTWRNSTVIFILVISGLSSIISIVSGTVNLQFQVSLFPFL